MADKRLHPVFQIRQPLGEPEHPPFSRFVTSDESFEEAQRAGGVSNLVRYRLDRDPLSYYDDDEERQASRNRAVSLGYGLSVQERYNNLEAWETVPTEVEQAQLTAEKAYYQQLVDELEAKPASPGLTVAEKELLTDYKAIIDAANALPGLIGNTRAYIQQTRADGIFGINGYCLRDLNGTPNVDKIRRSTFTIPRDHPFHLALYFDKPHEDQRETSFKIRWGPFVLEFRGGRTVLLSMYSRALYGDGGELNLAAIEAGESALQKLLDQTRLTYEDMEAIRGLEAQIRAKEKEARDQKLTSASPGYEPIYTAIKGLRAQIDAIRELKRRAPGEVLQEIEVIKKTQYAIYEQTLTLNESQENFYGQEGIVRLTVLPQERGYLSFALNGHEAVSIPIPDILESKEYGTLWEETRLAFQSNGGSFDWMFLFPAVNGMGEYRLQDVDLGFAITEDTQISYEGDIDASYPGCRITFDFEESENSTPERPLYDFFAQLRSDVGIDEDPTNTADIQNEYLPWLYSLTIFINAGPVPENTEPVWTSTIFGVTKTLNPGYPNVNFDNPIANATLVMEEIGDSARGANLVIDIKDPLGTIGFDEQGFVGHLCDFFVGIYNREWLEDDEGSPPESFVVYHPVPAHGARGIQPYLVNGIIREAVLMNARQVTDLKGVVADSAATRAERYGPDSFWRLTVGDWWSILSDYEIQDEVILDDLLLGEAIRRLLGLPGTRPEYMAGVPISGPLAGTRLPKPGPGQKAKLSPRRGSKLSAALLDLMQEYGITEDKRELRLYPRAGVWTLDVAAPVPTQTWTGGDTNTPRIIKGGLQRVNDWSRFTNSWVVEGGRSPFTKKRLSASRIIYESIDDPTHPLYVGQEKRAQIIRRPELDSQVDVENALDTAIIRNAKSGDVTPYESWWVYPMVYLGDRFFLDEAETPRELLKLSMTLEGATNAQMLMRPVVEGASLL